MFAKNTLQWKNHSASKFYVWKNIVIRMHCNLFSGVLLGDLSQLLGRHMQHSKSPCAILKEPLHCSYLTIWTESFLLYLWRKNILVQIPGGKRFILKRCFSDLLSYWYSPCSVRSEKKKQHLTYQSSWSMKREPLVS